MANTKELFIFSILFILLILDALIIKNEFSSFLEKLKSNLESMNEEKSRLSRKYEEDVAELKKMIAEYDEMKGNKKIHSNQ
ncbi:hypothetical protein A2U01_0033117, partial [Trifolium medium]|nr:hypothetical protein [Trifolium medium]